MTLAIGLHNVPEGLAVATVLVARGIPAKRALVWTLFTAAPQPLVALPAFLFVDAFRALLPVALGFAAGCMVWMVFAELLPDALADAPHAKVMTHLIGYNFIVASTFPGISIDRRGNPAIGTSPPSLEGFRIQHFVCMKPLQKCNFLLYHRSHL